MPYFAPYIDNTGLHIPSYIDIRDKLISDMKIIFGNDIYIDEDSQDYQQIASFAKMIFDSYNLAQLVYNNRTPLTAIGTGLDNVVSFANIKRKPATKSTVSLVVTGDPSTVIANGKAQDINGIDWSLPAEVVIPSGGSIVVVASCDTLGHVGALPNTITKIITPTAGWLSVTNTTAAVSGVNVETDSELRGRYSRAIQSPSKTVFESIMSFIEAINNVTRVVGYENDTSAVDSLGLPANSITFIVEGGVDFDIAEAIRLKKTPGCYTNGTTEVDITTETGLVTTIRFYRPTYVPVKIKVTLVKLSGWNPAYATSIKDAIANYISKMKIGEKLYRSIIWSVAVSAMSNVLTPAFSVTNVEFSTDGGSTWNTDDITVDFYKVVQAISSDTMVVET